MIYDTLVMIYDTLATSLEITSRFKMAARYQKGCKSTEIIEEIIKIHLFTYIF